jgi:hypothetical protein
VLRNRETQSGAIMKADTAAAIATWRIQNADAVAEAKKAARELMAAEKARREAEEAERRRHALAAARVVGLR